MVLFLLLLSTSFFDSNLCFVSGIYSQSTCRCVPMDLCGDAEVITGEGVLDVRFQKSTCENYFEVCCQNPLTDINLVGHNDSKKDNSCGFQRPIGVTSRIVQPTDTVQGELPWTTIVLMKNGIAKAYVYKCGGSLFHPQVVLTAAHCVSNSQHNILKVRAGEWDTRSQSESLPHQDRSVSEILVHPNYHKGSLRNDIALLFLEDPFDLADNVRLICLPPSTFYLEKSSCIASGWGRNAPKNGKHSTILKKTDLPLVSKEDCTAALRKTRLGPFYRLHKSFVCAGGETGKDTCKGDGGSPLVCPIPGRKDRYFQIGIVSWGIGCGQVNVPGVYVNVQRFSGWIDEELKARAMDDTLYKY